MRYKCVIFDWDGTVMDSVPKIVNTIHLAAKSCNMTPVSDSEAKSIIGLSLPVAMRVLFPHHEDKAESLASAYKYIYSNEDDTPSPIFEGVEPLLGKLRDRGIKIAVATGKSRTGLNRLMAQNGLTDYFVTTRTACEAESKPHPDMLLQILTELGVDAEDTVMVGDSIIDMDLASNAGVDAIGVTLGVASRDELSQTSAAHICDNYQDLSDLLLV
ncbi:MULTISPECIES: HAD family hydrolase [Pseudoalteromonas]|uniref:HAD family hydrolase n=1 Tax=Pseudoalteromonas TaxID=53246 RepID=UPI000FFE9BCD|nr:MULTISPECIES: HAD-IIIA family hydrolase [Pseudoalteromonas]MCG9758606.1 HAD-IIIA family hydrolase [Pseudoalteromonas sp. Isolate6]NKC18907.1 HAD-IIIA family hydrolase [Pseudoalteromonas galatheae]RXE87467.1 HAD family hydrolase [Pseudoalteromonas sp. A757]